MTDEAAEAKFWQHKKAVVGLGIIVAVGMCALFASVIAPDGPLSIDVGNQLKGPSLQHLAGTDEYGRDILSRVIYASRVSIEVALVSVSIGVTIGVTIGVIVAWFGGVTDLLLMRVMDVLYAFPAILLAIVIMGGLGVTIFNAMVAIGIIFIPGFARLTRATMGGVLNSQFIDAAHAMGMRRWRIVRSEILPNIMPPLLIQITQALAFAVIVEAALSFLGLGVQPPSPSWGNMLQDGRGFLAQDASYALAPAIALFITVLGCNLLGDGLRDYYDPRLR
jgi:peptide/nickel transport system permease protein